jgi:transposase
MTGPRWWRPPRSRAGAGVAELRPPAPHPALDQRPGVIEIDLPEGVRIRVDAFANERALGRVLRLLKDRA